MARILLGVSGGIAAYKSLELARLATLAGHGVRVLMTETATRFVGAASFEGIVGAPVLISEFERDPMRGAFPGDGEPGHDPIGHLELAANCDAFLVAPASANTIAKLAAGVADSMLTTSFLACAAPRLVAPAMNDRMYADAATQANLATLRERGVEVIEPEEGRLASRGEHGRGRLPDPERLLARVEAALPRGERPWDGLRVLVTAGGTREPIDPVRFIGNRSSGRMGIALAAAAARRGAEVTLIAANVALPEPRPASAASTSRPPSSWPRPPSAEFPATHVLLMAAAPADFRATEVADGQAQAPGRPRPPPRADRGHPRRARRQPRRGPDRSSASPPSTAETAVDRARAKLARKGADLIVLNDVSDPAIGFESDENAVTLIDADGRDRRPARLQGRDRRGDPRQGRPAPRREARPGRLR